MTESIVGRVLWLAVEDSGFRGRLLVNLGASLAEEGFVLSDAEMSTLREYYESLHNLNERRALERINALARAYHRG